MKIARRFNAGNQAASHISPKGTTDNSVIALPSLRDLTLFQPIPALKCRTIFAGSFGTKCLLQFFCWTTILVRLSILT